VPNSQDQPRLRTVGAAPSRTRGRKIVLSADEAAWVTYVSALKCLPGVGSVTHVPMNSLTKSVEKIKPELVVLSLSGPTDGLRALYQLLGPELRQPHVMAALHNDNADLTRVLGRLGVESHAIKPLDVEVLQDKVRTWLSGSIHSPLHAERRPEQGNTTTISLVAKVVRQAAVPQSAAEISARCGLSIVTCRRYLNQLVSKGKLSVNIQHRPVGRPVNLYRWLR
jgi:DNA-binding NarL/FixJ family response regulator